MKYLCLSIFFFVSIQLSAQVRQFTGTWTKLNTTYVFEFDLVLKHQGNKVEGYFIWKVVELDKHSSWSKDYYGDKIGLTGKEYIRGSWFPSRNMYKFKGYKKEDPHLIIGLDNYELQLDELGNIGGKTKTMGSWLGRINGELVEMDLL